MTSAWAGLGFSADGAIEALSATSVHVVESYARTRVEIARSEFRSGQFSAAFDTLSNLVSGLRPVMPHDEPTEGLALAFAISNSVLGQGRERFGDAAEAEEAFRESVEQFRAVDDTKLNPRDHSDFGIALAALHFELEALDHLRRSRAEGGATPEAARHHAVLLMGGGKTEVAEELLKEALLTTPADPDALRALGTIQAQREDGEAAATLASSVYALMSLGRHAEALEVLDVLESLTPGAELTGVRAEAERLDNRLESALASYQRALQDQPNKSWLLGGLASALLALDRARDAAAYIATAVESAPEDTALLDLGGEIALRTGDWDQVAELAQRAIAVDSHDASARYRLALAAQAVDDVPRALEVIQSARVLDPTNFDFLVLHADLALQAGSPEVAAELYRQICADPQASPFAYARLVWLLQQTGQTSSGIAVAESALGRFGDNEPVLVALGQLLLDADPAAGISMLQRAVDLPDHSLEATLALIRGLFDAGRSADALAMIEHAKEEAPDSADVYAVEARVLASTGDWSHAADSARTALGYDPDTFDALVVLGRAALVDDDAETAEALLRRAVGLSGQVSGRYYLACALLDSRPAEARELLDEIIEAGGIATADALQLRARLHLDRGKLKRGIADLEEAARLDPENESILIELADALRQNGDAERALHFADRALDLVPEWPFALAVRATALQVLGRIDEARRDLHHAITVDPDYGFAYILLARVASDAGEAQRHVDEARRLLPDDSRVEIEQAALFTQTQRYEEALATYERLLQSAPEPEVVGAYIDTLRLLGRLEEAVHEGERAMVELGDDPVVRRSLAIALVDAGRRADGIAHLAQLVETFGDASSKGDLGWALVADEQQDRALAVIDEALLAAPYDVWTRNQLSILLSDVGDYAQAQAFAVGASELDPSSVDAWAQIGWNARQQTPPDLDLALQAMERALTLVPEGLPDPWVVGAVAEIRHLLGDPRAEAGFREALALSRHSGSKGNRSLSTAGWCAYRLDDLKQSARLFLEAASLEDKPGSDAFDLALVTLCLGRQERARKLYADALRLIAASRHPLIQRGLIQVAIIDIGRAKVGHELDEDVTRGILADLDQALEGLPHAPTMEAPPTLTT
ncbi:tetratricopeptide repeat protein [Nocardioides sp.]|uniref:tetratricopeptide repeat protein n=1 Tax=Nocardioides sp. TaxID=35761 RepID=UPI003D0D070B